MRSTSIRFTGMASGMDTDSIVRDMLRPQQYKIDNQKKAQALVKLKQDAWKDMNKKLFDFHTKYTEKLYRGVVFKNSNTTSSNTDAMNITNGESVPQGTHTFQIEKLAESASVVGRGGDGQGLKAGTKLVEAGEETTLRMVVNDTIIRLKVGPEDTIEHIASKMNDALEGTGFTAKFDEANGGFFVNSTATGEEQTIDFAPKGSSQESIELFEKLGFVKVKGEGEDKKVESQFAGKDAEYKYNGADFTSATNNIEINGIKATLKAAGTGPITISSQLDTDDIYDFVKEFVAEYNKLIDEINEKVGTKPGKDIMPLTAEERESMSESEIKLWEEKLNSSLFYRDEQLTSFADSARNILSQVFNGKSLSNLGIVTGSWEERGKLHIEGDEDAGSVYANKPNKLKAAIEEDPQAVTDFLSKS